MQLPIQIRSCDGCTECCTGWLEGEIHGHVMKLGQPCVYKNNQGCSIYDRRPEHPCKTYLCAWAYDLNVPNWMKPSLSKVLLTTHKIGKLILVEIRECGQKMSADVLNWAFLLFAEKKINNLKYQIDGQWFYLSNEVPDLLEYINSCTDGRVAQCN